MVSVPSVTTMGGMPSHQTRTPLSEPRNAPMPTAMTIRSGSGMPGKAALVIATAMPVKARLAATERSMDFVRMTAIWPSARMMRMEVSLKMLTRLPGRPKPGARIAKPAIMTMMIPASSHSRFLSRRCMLAPLRHCRWRRAPAFPGKNRRVRTGPPSGLRA